jgi:hypothetical protein
MITVLNKCKQDVIVELIRRLSSWNLDVEESMNAHLILLELADNENCFGQLIEKDVAEALINAACDIKNPN